MYNCSEIFGRNQSVVEIACKSAPKILIKLQTKTGIFCNAEDFRMRESLLPWDVMNKTNLEIIWEEILSLFLS